MFHGSMVALATPFKNDKIDEKALRDLVEFQIKNGTHALVPCGSTGESATLTYEEHCSVIEIVIDQAKKRVPVIAGAGSNSTHETVFLTEHAKKAGADAVLLITPYYNKPSQEGLYRHFKAVAEAVEIPQIVYNVPSRTGVNMLPETVVRLSKVKGIAGIKEASGNLDQAACIIKEAGKGFAVLSGEDSLTFPMMCMGASGVISVVANIAPALMRSLCDKTAAGDMAGAREIYYKLFDICKGVFFETNPIPIKKALYLMGLAQDEIRLPLVSMTEENSARLRKIMAELGLRIVEG